MNYDITTKDALGLGLSVLLNTLITAFGAPIGPIIVALMLGVAIGVLIDRHLTSK
jgi:hypothetical protein